MQTKDNSIQDLIETSRSQLSELLAQFDAPISGASNADEMRGVISSSIVALRRLIESNRKILSLLDDHLPESKDIAANTIDAPSIERLAANLSGMLHMVRIGVDFSITSIYCSRGSIRLYEKTPEEIISGQHVMRNMLHPDEMPSFVSFIKAVIQSDEAVMWQGRFVVPSGLVKWIQVTSKVVSRDSTGALVDSLHLDITHQKNIEQQNLNIAYELKEAQEVAKIGSWSFDLRNFNVTWSSEHYRIFEIEEPQEQSVLNHLYRSKIHPDDLPQLDAITERAMTKGEGFVFNHRVMCKNGDIKYVQGIGNVKKDADGKPIRISGTCQDITDRVRTEEENRFILDTLQIGVWKYDPVSQKLRWDKSMHELFDVSEEDFANDFSSWQSCLTPQTKDLALSEVMAALRGDKEFNTTYEIETKRFGKRHIGARGRVTRSSTGEPLMMYGINFDRTKEVLAERELDTERLKSIQNSKLASLGEMSAGIAHEINNPLAIISGTVRILPKYLNDPEKLKERTDMIDKSIERIAKIVRSLKKFSRVTDHVERKQVVLSQIVNEALTLTEAKAKRHATEVKISIQTSGSIYCDEIEIEQVFVNLINNAIDAVKSNRDRWVAITVIEDSIHMVVQVCDSGPGIREEIRDKLFQPFFTTKAVGEGTGLGLSIVRGILDTHLATIDVLTHMKNTCFEIRFPKSEKSEEY